MKKKRNMTTLLLVVVILAGLSLLLYPSVSNFINSRNQSRVISDYNYVLSTGKGEDYARMISHANAYNQDLLTRDTPYALTPELQSRYDALLDLSSNGVMGYVEIPCIDCLLPVYHGTEEDVLQYAAGHVDWSSLPVGGESTHCIISGHRGLPTAELMTHIDRLRIGDRFYLNVLGQQLEYQVDQIKVVLPDDLTYLGIEEGLDLVTLVTCTPYGINSHRLLVRGTRMENGRPASGQLFLTNETEPVSLIYLLPVSLLLLTAVCFLIWGIRHLLKPLRKEKHHGTSHPTTV